MRSPLHGLTTWMPDDEHTEKSRVVTCGEAIIKDGIIIDADPVFCGILRASEPSVPGMNLSALYRTENGLKQFLSRLYTIAGTQSHITIATSWCRSDGSVADIMLRATPVRPGRNDEWVFEAGDVTVMSRPVRLKTIDEKAVAMFLEHSPIGFGLLFFEPSGDRIMGWHNPAMGKMFGYEDGSLLGKSTRMLYRDEDGFLESGKIIKSRIEDNGALDFMTRLMHRDGLMIDVRIQMVPIRSGNEISLLTIMEDISRQVRAERKYKNLFDASMDAIFLFDPESGRLDCNPAAFKLFGFDSKDAFLKRTPINLSPDYQPDGTASADKAAHVIERALEKGSYLFEWRHKKRDGQEFDASVLLSEIEIEGRSAIQTTLRDISSQKETQKVLIQSEKMMSVGGMAAGMVHEINNPLAGVLQNINVIDSRLTDRTMKGNIKAAEEAGISMDAILKYMEARQIPRLIETVSDAGFRMAELVNNMLNFVRKSDSSFSFHDPAVLMEKVLIMASMDYDLKKKYDFRSIKIEKDYEPDLPMISCAGSEIQQVLYNVLNNGAQAMFERHLSLKGYSAKFRIGLSREPESDFLKIVIEDNGPGIDEKTRSRIFEPFFTTKPKGRGTGLGLSVAYFIITHNHKGTITVESEPGKGAAFIIHLPFSQSRHP